MTLQGCAQLWIERRQLFLLAQALTVRRIGHQRAGRRRRAKLQQIRRIDPHPLAETGLFQIPPGSPYGALVMVGTTDVQLCRIFHPRQCSIADVRPQRGIKFFQALETEVPVQAGRPIEGHLHRFEEEGTATAHGINQRCIRLPAAQFQDAGGQILLHRRIHAGPAKTSLPQGLTGRIQIQGAAIGGQENMHTDIRIAGIDVGALTRIFAETVAHGILDAQGDEIQRFERALDGGGDHPESVGDGEMIRPQLPHRQPVNIVFPSIGSGHQVPQDAGSQARFQIGAIAHRPVTGKVHAAVRDFQLGRPERGKFILQQRFQAARADGEIVVHDQKGLRTTRKMTASRTSTGTSLKKRNQTCDLRLARPRKAFRRLPQ